MDVAAVIQDSALAALGRELLLTLEDQRLCQAALGLGWTEQRMCNFWQKTVTGP